MEEDFEASLQMAANKIMIKEVDTPRLNFSAYTLAGMFQRCTNILSQSEWHFLWNPQRYSFSEYEAEVHMNEIPSFQVH